MVLVDTSVWIDHLRKGNPHLKVVLEEGEVMCHPFVLGELACGNLKNRDEVLSLLESLPAAKTAEDQEILAFIEFHSLMGHGLGLVDVHLLASALLSNVSLWTADRRLREAAGMLNLQYR